MMGYVLAALAVISLVGGIATGQMEAVSAAALSGCSDAVELSLLLLGSLCLWSGLMEVAKESGLVAVIGRALRPLLRLLFPGLPQDSPAAGYLTMNISANLLGVGNAATPLGLKAMLALHELSVDKRTANRYMITLVVLNTASITIIPTTMATLRLEYGAANPLDVLPAVWLASIGSVAAGLMTAWLLGLGKDDNLQKQTDPARKPLRAGQRQRRERRRGA